MALEVSIKRCCVLNCSTQRSGKNDVSKIAMHRLPRPGNNGDEEVKKARAALRTRWLCLAGCTENDITVENEYVCGKHFLPKAYHHIDGDNKKVRKLNQNAEPSVFLPVEKESTDSKKSASSLSTESEDAAGLSSSSPNLAGNEQTCEVLLSNEAEEISPVEASLDVDTPSTTEPTEPTEPDFYEFEMDSNQASVSAKKDDKYENIPKDDSVTAVSLNGNDKTYSRAQGVKKAKHEKRRNSKSIDDPVIVSSSGHDDSDDVSKEASPKESNEPKNPTTKVTQVDPAPKSRCSTSQKNQLPAVNGDLDESSSMKNGIAPPTAASVNASASKRRFCEDSDENSTAESQRKKINDDQKSQARIKYSPRRSDLQGDANAISHPDIVAGVRNKHGYLKGFTEALLNEALRHLRNAFENQSTQMTRILGQLSADSKEIEERFRDLSCKMNSCKRAESIRNVGIQMSSLASSLPSMTADIPAQLKSTAMSISTAASGSVPTLTSANCAPQATGQCTPVFVRRGRPPANSRPMTSMGNVQTSSNVENVIDLTDDTPQVSVVCASNGTNSTNLTKGAFSSATFPSAFSRRFVTSLTTSNTPKLLSCTLPIPALTPLASAVATGAPTAAVESSPKTSASSPVVIQSTSKNSNSLPNLVTNTFRFSTPTAVAQPVPVGSIFPGQQLVPNSAVKTLVPPIISSDSQLPSASCLQNKSALVGTTFRLPPGTIVHPVSKASPVSQSLAEAQEQQKRLQQHQQQQQQQQQHQQQHQQHQQQHHHQQHHHQHQQQHHHQQQQLPHQQQQQLQHQQQHHHHHHHQQQQQQQQLQQTYPLPQQSLQTQLEKPKPRTSGCRLRHPAPLPEAPTYNNIGQLHTPPAPVLDVKANDEGIVLTLDMQLQANFKYSPAEKFQIFTYMEGEHPPSTDLWRNIGTIKALKLPMAVTVRSYKPGHRYFFAVRGVDRLNRLGAFNDPKSVDLRESIVL